MQLLGRRVLGVAILIVATVALATGAAFKTEPVEAAYARVGPNKPNILLIITDDQRNGLDVMPALRNRIQEEGTTYTHAFATTPLCCPARANIFTGKYSHNHGVVDNQHAGELNPKQTVQYFLKKAGYRTGIVGKYLNSVRRSGPPAFRQHAVLLSKDPSRYYYDGRWTVSGKGVVRPKMYSTHFIRKQVGRILGKWDDRDDDKPWFMVVTPTAPHSPATTTRKYQNAPIPDFNFVKEKDRSDKPSYVQKSRVSPQKGATWRARSLRALMPVDDMIAGVVRGLNRLKESSNTLVIYVSDNGFLWAEHGLSKKSLPYTEAVKVPLLLKWPGRIQANAIDARLVGNVDIAPTILDAVGMNGRAANMDGRSLLNRWRRNRILLEFEGVNTKSGPWASTRTLDYQYIHYDSAPNDSEYYDLGSDPNQLENLLKDDNPLDPSPPDVTELEMQLEEDRNCKANSCP